MRFVLLMILALHSTLTLASFSFGDELGVGQRISKLLRNPTFGGSSPEERKQIPQILEDARSAGLNLALIFNYRDSEQRNLVAKALKNGFLDSAVILAENGAILTDEEILQVVNAKNCHFPAKEKGCAPLLIALYKLVLTYPEDLLNTRVLANKLTLPMLFARANYMDEQTLELVQRKDFDPSVSDEQGLTTLLHAVRLGSERTAAFLIRQEQERIGRQTADEMRNLVRTIADSKSFQLYQLVELEEADIAYVVARMPDRSFDPTRRLQNLPVFTALFAALKKSPNLINSQYRCSAYHETIVMFALRNGLDDEVVELIRTNPEFDPNIKAEGYDSTRGWNAGHYAAYFRNPRSALAIAMHEDFDVNSTTREKATMALIAAKHLGNHAVLEALMRRGADMSITSSTHWNPVTGAFMNSHYTCGILAMCSPSAPQLDQVPLSVARDLAKKPKNEQLRLYVEKLNLQERAKVAYLALQLENAKTGLAMLEVVERAVRKDALAHLPMVLYAFEDRVIATLAKPTEMQAFHELLRKHKVVAMYKLAAPVTETADPLTVLDRLRDEPANPFEDAHDEWWKDATDWQ